MRYPKQGEKYNVEVFNDNFREVEKTLSQKSGMIVTEHSGAMILANGTAAAPIQGLSVFGKSEQDSTTGANLWPYGDITGVAGSNVFNGSELILPAGTYTFKCDISANDGSSFAIAFYDSTGVSILGMNVMNNDVYDGASYTFTLNSDCATFVMYTRSNVTYSNPMLNAGDTALPWEPYTGGKPSPNPEYPQEIESVGVGKNLLPYPYVDTTKTTNGITFTDNGDGSITVNGTATGGNATFALYKPTATDKFENTFISGAKDTNCIIEYTNKRTITFADTGSGKAITFTHNIADFPNTVFHLQVDSGKTVNNVTIYPMLNTGDKALPWEPYDAVKVKVLGAQLWDGNTNSNILNVEKLEPGRLKLNGTIVSENDRRDIYLFGSWANTESVGISGTVTLSVNDDTIGVYLLSNTSVRQGLGAYTHTFDDETPFTAAFIRLPVGTYTNKIIDIMLNYGDIPLPWEPYTEQVVDISTPNGLPGIPVDSGGNYTDSDGQQYIADEIRLNADGTGVWVHNVGVIDFNGLVCVMNEMPIDSGIYRFEFRYADNPNIAPSAIAYGTTGYCTALSYRFNPLGYNDVDNAIAVYNNGGFYARCDQFETADDFLAHMQSIDAKVYYILAEPYETELSAEEIEAFLDLRTNKPVTTIMNDAGAYMEAELVADTKLYIDAKIEELKAALGG